MTQPGDALGELGWDARWHALFAPHAAKGLEPGRVVRSDRGSALVAVAAEVLRARPAAQLLKAGRSGGDLPGAGDWVALAAGGEGDTPAIEAVLARRSAITRSDPGETGAVQVLAANIDTVFVVHPIGQGPNLRRIERELSLAWDSGAAPVVVLTKADLSPDPGAARAAVEAVAPGTDVLLTNPRAGEGVEPLREYTSGHRTAVLIGPSGAGKSTLVNALLGRQQQATREVRVSDDRGRHTTVVRELFPVPGGGVLIDTPGLRALGLTGSGRGIASAFADVAEIARACRFRDCTHAEEPECAVREAVAAGDLDPERVASYRKLVREAGDAAGR